MMSTMMPILSRSWHGPLYRLKYQRSQRASRAGPRHEGPWYGWQPSRLFCWATTGSERVASSRDCPKSISGTASPDDHDGAA